MPTVSVVIPTYNRARLLHRSIESVLDQTYTDFELIVVDDGSTDHTHAVVQSYDDSRISYIAHDENRGASAARNTGIDHAEGEYIAFLDSDDEWRPTKIEQQVTELQSRPPEWVAVYTGVELINNHSQLLTSIWKKFGWLRMQQTEGEEGGLELIKAILKDELHTSAGSTLLVKREVVDAVDGFDESFDRFQDPEFLIRVLRHGKLAYLDETLVRRYDTGRPAAAAIEQSDRRYLTKFADTVRELERNGHDIRGVHHRFLARFYCEDGQFRSALKHARRATFPQLTQIPGMFHAILTGLTTTTPSDSETTGRSTR